MSKLNIEIDPAPESVTVTLSGSLEPSTLPRVEETLHHLLDSREDGVNLNLYECEYIDEASLQRLVHFTRQLKERVRPFRLYVRPMSFVAYRSKPLSPSLEIPSAVSERGEKRLAEKRMARLRRWRKEKPIRNPHPPGVLNPPPVPSGTEVEHLPHEGGHAGEDLVPIDFKRVSLLAEKDERVIRRIWETYSRFLDTGAFSEAPDGEAATQLMMDARTVARELRLNPKDVQKVIESVSTHLMDLLESEEE